MDARQALLGGVAAIALGAGLMTLPAELEAQSALGTVTTQSSFKADAATFFAGSTRTNCTTTQETVANLTITITPPAGNYVYLTGFYAEVAPNATAASSQTIWSSTNLTGSPSWLLLTNASSASVPTLEYFISEIYPTAIKSTVAGTPVTIVPLATAASAYVCAHAVGYYNPT